MLLLFLLLKLSKDGTLGIYFLLKSKNLVKRGVWCEGLEILSTEWAFLLKKLCVVSLGETFLETGEGILLTVFLVIDNFFYLIDEA